MTDQMSRPVHDLESMGADELRELAGQLQTALRTRIVIEQAKGVLAQRYGLPVEVVFELLRRYCRTNRHLIHDVAAEVVQGAERATDEPDVLLQWIAEMAVSAPGPAVGRPGPSRAGGASSATQLAPDA